MQYSSFVQNSSQVPLWVPLMVAVLAVAGTIVGALGGQLVAGRNENRRSQQERQHEHETYWRERRLATYSAFLSASIDFVSLLHNRLGGEVASEDDLVVIRRSLKQELELIRTIGTPDVIDLAQKSQLAMGYASHLLLDLELSRDEISNVLRGLDEDLFQLQALFRRDLGI